MHLPRLLPPFLFLSLSTAVTIPLASIPEGNLTPDTYTNTNLTDDPYICYDDDPSNPGPRNLYEYCHIALQNLVHLYPSRQQFPKSERYWFVHDCAAFPTRPNKLLCPIKEAAKICEVTVDYKITRYGEPDEQRMNGFEMEEKVGTFLGQLCTKQGKFRGGRGRQYLGIYYIDVILKVIEPGKVEPASAKCDGQ